MKTIIGYDMETYNRVLDILKTFISTFNDKIGEINKDGWFLTIEDIKAMLEDRKKYINSKYSEEYKSACKFLGLEYDIASKKVWIFQNSALGEALRNKAHTHRFILLDELSKKLCGIIGYYSLDKSLLCSILEIDNGKLKPIKNYQTILKDAVTFYAENSKQAKVADTLTKVKVLLDDINLNTFNVDNYFFVDDTLNYKAILKDF